MKTFLIYIIVATLVCSCNMFEPRDAEDPTVQKSDYKPPTDPDIVIENLISAVKEKNSINYTQCLGGPNLGFSFTPAAESKSNFLSIYVDWDVNSEKAYFENLIIQTAKDSPAKLSLNNPIRQSSSDSVIYNANYTFSFQHSANGIPQISVGNLQFTIKRDKNNNWYITRWIDLKTANQFSWSDMKARFSN